MEKGIITELAYFAAKKTINDEDLIGIIDELEINFHMKQAGFISTELLKTNKGDQWVMVQHWDSINNAKNAGKNMMITPETEKFRNVIDPGTVKISFFTLINRWEQQD